MFQKKDYVFVGGIGVCRVDEITNLTQKDGTTYQYYGLRSMENTKTTAYYPVENHEVEIRPLITVEEANALLAGNLEDVKHELLWEAKFVTR